MRNLKYAILGLVNIEPMTGYDIKKAFEDSGFQRVENEPPPAPVARRVRLSDLAAAAACCSPAISR